MNERLHLCNADIWTGDEAHPAARCLTICDGRIVSVDRDDAHTSDLIIDAGGAAVCPGLIDAHMHLLEGGFTLGRLDLSQVRSRDAFEGAIAEASSRLDDGVWLQAFGWSQENWGGAMPDASWLRAAGERPAVCYRLDLHAAVVNEAVLKMCDLSHDPPGGRIVRDERTGEPTGMLLEAAAWELVNPIIPTPTLEAQRDALAHAEAHCMQFGLTAVGAMEYARTVREVLEPMRNKLSLRCRVTVLDRTLPLDLAWIDEAPSDDRLAIIGCKAFADGTLGSRTARMLADYSDDPGNRGLLVELAKDGTLIEWARQVAGHGLSPSIHAIGDEAVRMALDAAEAVSSDRRPRIEHAQHIAMDDIPRFAGRIASMQPLHRADDGRYAEHRVGRDRLAGAFALRSLSEIGAVLAFGSDWPVVSCDPLSGVHAAVTGLTLDEEIFTPEQTLSVEQTLRAYTAGAAYALGMDDAGRLRPGGLGDFVMFDRDPFMADWRVGRPQIVLTVIGGRVVHDAR